MKINAAATSLALLALSATTEAKNIPQGLQKRGNTNINYKSNSASNAAALDTQKKADELAAKKKEQENKAESDRKESDRKESERKDEQQLLQKQLQTRQLQKNLLKQESDAKIALAKQQAKAAEKIAKQQAKAQEAADKLDKLAKQQAKAQVAADKLAADKAKEEEENEDCPEISVAVQVPVGVVPSCKCQDSMDGTLVCNYADPFSSYQYFGSLSEWQAAAISSR